MAKLIDYKCTFLNELIIGDDILNKEGIIFPDVHTDYDMMMHYVKVCKEIKKVSFYELPFCHTIEAELLGGIINYGDKNNGPRVKQYKYKNIDEVLNINTIDYDIKRVHIILKVIKELIKNNEDVVYEVTGVFTILNNIIDSVEVYKVLRNGKNKMNEVYKKIGDVIYDYIKSLIESDVKYISFADPSASINIIGPKLAREYVEVFLYDFIKKILLLAKDNDAMVMLCPKITFILYGLELVRFNNINVSKEMKYFDALKEVKGKTYLTGQMCIKNSEYILSPALVKELVLVKE